MQTKCLGLISRDRLGEYLERILAAYRSSIRGDEGVPHELLAVATEMDPAHVPQGRAGPADAVGEVNDDVVPEDHDSAEPDGKHDVQSSRQDYSSAVIDTGLEEFTPLQLWNVAMTKYKVLEECGAIINALGPADTSTEKEQALRDETWAIAEAAQALRRLAKQETRAQLDEFVREETTCNDAEVAPNMPQSKTSVTRRARQELRTFQQQTRGADTVLKLKHEPELLSSFRDDFCVHCFVDLFFSWRLS